MYDVQTKRTVEHNSPGTEASNTVVLDVGKVQKYRK